ncbi:hypothetical protein [Arthrobacter sp. TMS1-12-1]
MIGALEAPLATDDNPPTEADIVYLDEGTSRLLTKMNGLLFFAGVETTDFGSAACLAIVAPGPGQTTGGCDLTDGELIGAPYIAFGVEARLIADGADVGGLIDEGWEQPHPNLILRRD